MHPETNNRGYHTTLVSPRMDELNPLFRDFAEMFSVNVAPYRVDPHSKTDMAGLGGTWRWMGCNDTMDVSCLPQRVSRWRYVGHEREHQSSNLLLSDNIKTYAGRVNKLNFDPNNENRVDGVEFTDKDGQTYVLN